MFFRYHSLEVEVVVVHKLEPSAWELEEQELRKSNVSFERRIGCACRTIHGRRQWWSASGCHGYRGGTRRS